jgi:hypothetical protein
MSEHGPDGWVEDVDYSGWGVWLEAQEGDVERMAARVLGEVVDIAYEQGKKFVRGEALTEEQDDLGYKRNAKEAALLKLVSLMWADVQRMDWLENNAHEIIYRSGNTGTGEPLRPWIDAMKADLEDPTRRAHTPDQPTEAK